MKTILLFFFGMWLCNAQAQLTAYVSTRQHAEKNNRELLHDICIKTYPNRTFVMQFDYYQNQIKVDSFTVHTTSDEAKFYNQYWHHTIAYTLPYGAYTCNVSIEDVSTKENFSTTKNIELFDTDSVALSPISLFIKDSSVAFLPICFENFCDTYVHHFIAKTSIFHPEKINEKTYIYTRIAKKNKPNYIFYSHTDSIDARIIAKKVWPYQTAIPLANLQSGNYIATISLYIGTRQVSRQQSNFQCVRPLAITATKAVQIDEDFTSNNSNFFAQSFVAKYDAAALKRNLLSLQAIVSPNQFKLIQQIAEGKDDSLSRRFFYNFWVNKNNANPEKEWKEYLTKLNECVKNYGGISTDQAFIFLKYGKPDKVETVLNEINTIPYEVWQYETIETLSNIVFLFIQRNGVNNQMNLLHSTHPAEKKMMQWQQFLIKGETQNNRVLEYLAPDGKSR
jgi:GWxTD domain-containing protein